MDTRYYQPPQLADLPFESKFNVPWPSFFVAPAHKPNHWNQVLVVLLQMARKLPRYILLGSASATRLSFVPSNADVCAVTEDRISVQPALSSPRLRQQYLVLTCSAYWCNKCIATTDIASAHGTLGEHPWSTRTKNGLLLPTPPLFKPEFSPGIVSKIIDAQTVIVAHVNAAKRGDGVGLIREVLAPIDLEGTASLLGQH
ncbi:hypothetical protein FRB94_013118 [Tulasnella sp. JGI-2019a]|nr:hypothetical protein FRB93_001585 [Tulasnella sp. JGI-2019a]KAG9008505.1 hypothetical protein FRB94_013118 [Tulasnella sp. JGI-2019a]KAG9034837.1 hypothetical protein FRB95_012530 [Tulasnella sp. JGI-2019a]